MEKQINESLHAAIKLRHLTASAKNNWQILNNTKNFVQSIIAEANHLMSEYGSENGQKMYKRDYQNLSNELSSAQAQLDKFAAFIRLETKMDIEDAWNIFNKAQDEMSVIFSRISNYSGEAFTKAVSSDWKDTWDVIKSNLYTVRGVGETAYIEVKMIAEFGRKDADELTARIVRHIPQSFNLLEADKYKADFLQAVKEIEEESGKKDNLWDRFLNFLAGNIPFKQTPEERVMMRRWLDGEKGEL